MRKEGIEEAKTGGRKDYREARTEGREDERIKGRKQETEERLEEWGLETEEVQEKCRSLLVFISKSFRNVVDYLLLIVFYLNLLVFSFVCVC